MEWPPGPPTVERLHQTDPTPSEPASATVVDLSTSRSLRLLQATLEHLETAVEMGLAQDGADVAGLREALQHLHRAKVCLTDLAAPSSPLRSPGTPA